MTSGRYAEGTSVPVERSKAEIERILTRYGADQFLHGWDSERAFVMFRFKTRTVRLVLPIPSRNAEQFKLTPGKKFVRTPASQDKAWQESVQRSWRALALVIKAKLEAVDTGITTFENEFLAFMMLPDGSTVGDAVIQHMDSLCAGKPIASLTALASGR